MGIVRGKKLRAGGGTDDGYIGTVDVKRYNFYSLFFFTDLMFFFSEFHGICRSPSVIRKIRSYPELLVVPPESASRPGVPFFSDRNCATRPSGFSNLFRS